MASHTISSCSVFSYTSVSVKRFRTISLACILFVQVQACLGVLTYSSSNYENHTTAGYSLLLNKHNGQMLQSWHRKKNTINSFLCVSELMNNYKVLHVGPNVIHFYLNQKPSKCYRNVKKIVCVRSKGTTKLFVHCAISDLQTKT